MGNLRCQSALMTEALAIREALMVCSNEGWRDLEVKSDSILLIAIWKLLLFLEQVGREHSWDYVGVEWLLDCLASGVYISINSYFNKISQLFDPPKKKTKNSNLSRINLSLEVIL